MVRISGDEDEQRRLHLHHALNDGEAVEPGHLDIEKDEVWLVSLDGADRFAPVSAGFHDLHVGMRLQPELEALDGEAFIVDENGANGHAATLDGSAEISGISMMTL